MTALRPDGGVVWRGEVKQSQETAHLSGPVAGATTLRIEWQRADGKRGRRQHGLVLAKRILGVEGHATFTEDTEQPKLALAFLAASAIRRARWDARLRVRGAHRRA